ncbi:MAG: aspartate kinase [Treponema sp. RIFOXYC1_FULL_61_9]|nr:MAG: aspartate kinase [Treponema sp. RIFOXYC1_FULL_61_9]
MIVMKFGGSSVADAERIRHVALIVKEFLPRKPVLVLSAMGDTTDHLLEAADEALGGKVSIERIEGLHLAAIGALGLGEDVARTEILPLLEELKSLLIGISLIRELTGRTKDYLVSFGERLSVRVAAAYFRSIGVKSKALDAWDAGLRSDSNYTSAEVLDESYASIAAVIGPLVESGILPVVTGFIAKTADGHITTLGRGGSDLTATVIGAAAGAEEVQVWKDVAGILTADPRLVKDARPVSTVTYEEASELAYFGAQVLHPRSMQPCKRTGTPVRVKNSYNPAAPGTRIVSSLEAGALPVRAITSKKNVTLVDIVSSRMLGQHGFLARVFASFEERRLSVDMVATSEVSISLTLDAAHDLVALKRELEKIASVDIRKGKAIVTLIGDVSRSSEILETTFGVCARSGVQVQMVSQGASKVNISFIVDDDQAGEVVKALHAAFFA